MQSEDTRTPVRIPARRLVDELVTQRRARFLETTSLTRARFVEQIRETALAALFQPSEHQTTNVFEGRKKKPVSKKGVPRTTPQGTPNPAATHFARMLSSPDFMVAIPGDLSEEWLVYRKPEGERAILVAALGKACVFGKSGQLLLGGPFATNLPAQGCTILDGILVDEGCTTPPETAPLRRETKISKQDVFSNKRFLACDCLYWADVATGDTEAECRLFLLRSRFEEATDLLETQTNFNRLPLSCIPVMPATPENLTRLYAHAQTCLPLSFDRSISADDPHLTSAEQVQHENLQMFSDALCFVHRASAYNRGFSECCLIWRDPFISRWAVDTTTVVAVANVDAESHVIPQNVPAFAVGQPPTITAPLDDEPSAKRYYVPCPRQQANLLLRLRDGAVLTLDRIIVAKVPTDSIKPTLEALTPETVFLKLYKAGKIKSTVPIRVSFSGIRLDSQKGTTQSVADLLVDFRIDTTPSPKKSTADCFSRILHQYLMRRQLRAILQNELGTEGRNSVEGSVFSLGYIPLALYSMSRIEKKLALKALTHDSAALVNLSFDDIIRAAASGCANSFLIDAVESHCIDDTDDSKEETAAEEALVED